MSLFILFSDYIYIFLMRLGFDIIHVLNLLLAFSGNLLNSRIFNGGIVDSSLWNSLEITLTAPDFAQSD
jgi:hypothetical protein